MNKFNEEIFGKVVSENEKKYLKNLNNFGVKIDVGRLLEGAKDGEKYRIIIQKEY